MKNLIILMFALWSAGALYIYMNSEWTVDEGVAPFTIKEKLYFCYALAWQLATGGFKLK